MRLFGLKLVSFIKLFGRGFLFLNILLSAGCALNSGANGLGFSSDARFNRAHGFQGFPRKAGELTFPKEINNFDQTIRMWLLILGYAHNRTSHLDSFSLENMKEEAFTKNVSYLMAVTFAKQDPDKVTRQICSKCLRDFFEGEFPGKVVCVEKEEYVKFSIKDARGYALENKNYWEDLEFIFFLNIKKNQTTATIVASGKYASGIGKPQSKDYKDIELDYANEFKSYNEKINEKILKHLNAYSRDRLDAMILELIKKKS